MDTILEYFTHFWMILQHGILPRLGYLNYFLLALLVMIEGMVSILLGAAAASAGILKLPLVIIAACCGNLISDILWYRLGYSGKMEWITHLTRKFTNRPQLVEYLKHGLNHHAWKVLLLAKFTSGLAIPTLITTGLARVPMKRWFPIVVIGETIKTTILAFLGFYATEAIKQVTQDIRYIMLLGTILFIMGFLLWFRKVIKNNQTYKIYFGPQEKQEK